MMNTSMEQVTKRIDADSLNVVHLLFQDVCKLPIVTSQCQEMWLGIQIKAQDWTAYLCDEIGLDPAGPSASIILVRTAYKVLLERQSRLEARCLEVGEIFSPKVKAWAAELLSARQNVFELHRSRLRRFIRGLASIADESARDELTDCACSIAELLCLLPSSVLSHIVEFEQRFERLPSADEMAEWLETSSVVPKQLLQAVRRQAKVARDTLVIGYLRYALRVARNRIGQGLDYLDLAQEGFIGLMKAADRFDYRQRVRFATYATSWIWQNIGRAIADQGRTIRLPAHLEDQIHKLEEAHKKCADSVKGYPTLVDLLSEMNLLPESDLEAIRRSRSKGVSSPEPIPRRCEKAVRKVERLMRYAQRTIPLDLTLPDGVIRNAPVLVRDCLPGDVALFDLIPDWDGPTPETVTDMAIARGQIEQALGDLTSRERDVITLRFGLLDGQDRTLEEIGQKFGLTRERIRQIEEKATEKLKLALYLLSAEAAASETPLIYMPFEVLVYLYSKFDCWRCLEIENGSRECHWLDRLIDQLPGGHWHRRHFGDTVTRQDQLVNALRVLLTPAHCSEITEQLNDALEEEELDEKYVYGLLTKYEETFLLLGQGVFSLVEWERNRVAQAKPVLPFCPSALPDPPDQRDMFFESVLIARDVLRHRPTANHFLRRMFKWSGTSEVQPKWLQQNVLSAYYLVDLIPYTFCFDGSNPRLECTLPEMGLHELRRYCLQRLTERLMAMPEFWWTFQRYQPVRPSVLGEQFTEVHPLGLDDATNRLSILTSLGASQRLTYGQYRLTLLGEELADQWKQRPIFAHGAEIAQELQPEDDLEPIDLAIW
jgi:RNA polymerase sigma factor (sigma-70 family)